MDVVMLPKVSSQAPVEAALALLSRRERSGLVVQFPDGDYKLLYAGDLLRARVERIGTCGQVRGARPIVALDPQTAGTRALDLVQPTRTWQAYETFFANVGEDYALAGESRDTVMIVTHHEEQTKTLTMTGGYMCNGTPTHYFPEPRVSARAPCPLYPECSRPDGSRPTIQPA